MTKRTMKSLTLGIIVLLSLAFGASTAETAEAKTSKAKLIAVGVDSACLVDESNKIVCWGAGKWGQVNLPSLPGTIVQIAYGGDQYCALTDFGNFFCWNATLSTSWFQKVSKPEDLGVITKIAVSRAGFCVLNQERHMACWGSKLPNVSVLDNPENKFLDLDLADSEVCGVTENHSVICFGKTGVNSSVITEKGDWTQITFKGISLCLSDTFDKTSCWIKDSRTFKRLTKEWCARGLTPCDFYDQNFTGLIAVSDLHACGYEGNSAMSCYPTLKIYLQHGHPVQRDIKKLVSFGDSVCELSNSGRVACWTYSDLKSPKMIENVPAQYMELKNVPVGKVSLFATGKYLQVGGWGNLPNGKPLNIEVEWLRNGKSFQRNTSIMYAPIKFDKGKKISAKIFVNYPGYKSLVLVSNAIYIK